MVHKSSFNWTYLAGLVMATAWIMAMIGSQAAPATAWAPSPFDSALTATPDATPTWTPTSPATVTPLPTPAATSTSIPPTPTPTPVSDDHFSLLVSDAAMSIGGVKSSDILIALQNVPATIQQIEVRISFDPAIITVQDADQDAANGIQVAVTALFGSGQQIVLNQADNQKGQVNLIVSGAPDLPVQPSGWQKLATITWRGQQVGRSNVAIENTSRLLAGTDAIGLNTAFHGAVFVRKPGEIVGAVRLQGRSDKYGGIGVFANLVAAQWDKAQTDAQGLFTIKTSHGEGFYTLTASMPGYLSAESETLVRVTMDDVTHAGTVTLLGGDVNGDNRIDIRDLSFVAWHFGSDHAPADINADGLVDILDLTLVAGNFGRQGPTPWDTTDQE